MSQRLFLNVASVVQDGYADVREEDSEEEPERDLDSDAERLAPAHRAQRPRRSVPG